ncbi:chitin disaccharide deacetylase [Erysipelothrix sp. HDW6A]|uniref:chitin disaccharide deacetylase n=1 Tax=Erysipelothrix sp. HDW6A TaxID=2714928 RepID=UPI001408C6B7|nr:chitin disaccharide deacetylase [Erysipelothrix sp. HDW6A]QIK57089.1 chitin disaccharide deacetylase [Erysipelothrix sp. HDW6A]
MKKLIINADDYGYTPGVTHGILSAHLNGVVTSTTALTVSEYFEQAMKLARYFPTLKIGVHLTLTLNGGRPLLGDRVPSLTNSDGTFWNQREFEDKVDLKEVEDEWFEQVNRFYCSGMVPTHIDSHHGVHCKNEELLKIAVKIAKHFGLPLRNCARYEERIPMLKNYGDVKTTDRIISTFYGDLVTIKHFEELADEIKHSDSETFEVNCHPAFIDNVLMNSSVYIYERLEEYNLLTSDAIKEILKKRNIELTSFETLK